MSTEEIEVTPILVGIDGGGSRTRVLVTDAAGNKLARVEGEASALRPGSESDAAETIAALLATALEKAGRAGVRPSICVVGVAGWWTRARRTSAVVGPRHHAHR